MTLSVKPQASIQLSAYIVKAFVSPIRKSGSGRWPNIKGSRNRPTDKQASLHTRYEEGQGTQNIIDDYFCIILNPCILLLGWIVPASGYVSLGKSLTR